MEPKKLLEPTTTVSQINIKIPTKHQAIVFTSVDGLRVQDYLLDFAQK